MNPEQPQKNDVVIESATLDRWEQLKRRLANSLPEYKSEILRQVLPDMRDFFAPDISWDEDGDIRYVGYGSTDLNGGADLSSTDLSSIDLSYAYLYRANLSNANLSGANLSNANLSGANLRNANLSGANLSNANLSGVNLSDAKLSGAKLSGANLIDVDLSGADLIDVDLSGAKLSGADLSTDDEDDEYDGYPDFSPYY